MATGMRRASKLRLATDQQLQQLARVAERGDQPPSLLYNIPGVALDGATTGTLGRDGSGGSLGGRKGQEPQTPASLTSTTRPLNDTYRGGEGGAERDWTERFKDAWWYPLWSCYRPLHRCVVALATSTAFEGFIMLVTFVNCIFMATDDPRSEDLPYQTTASTIFTAVFGLEFVLKLLAQGPPRYFGDPWNLLDVAVLIQGILDYFMPSSLGALKALRVLRALGSFKRIPQLRSIVSTLLRSLPSMRDITTVTLFVLFLLAIFGSMLWEGLFKYQCVDPGTGALYQTDTGMAQVCGYRFAVNDTINGASGGGDSCSNILDMARPQRCPSGYSCVNVGQSPNHGLTGFDNVLLAMMNWFQIISMQGWSEILFYTQMSMGRETVVIFVAVILLGAGVLVNLLIAAMMARLGAVLSNSNSDDKAGEGKGEGEGEGGESSKGSSDGDSDSDSDSDLDSSDGSGSERRPSPPPTTITQDGEPAANTTGLSIVRSNDEAKRRKRRRPRGLCGCLLYGAPWKALKHQVHHDGSRFNVVSTAAIVVSVLCMTLDAYRNPPAMTKALGDITHGVAYVFCIEFIVKLAALGLRGYFGSLSNVFDFVIIVGFALESALDGESSMASLRVLRFMRLIRLLRMGRLAKKYPAFVRVIAVLGRSFVTCWPIIVLLMLFTFIYAILAMDLFGGTLPHDDYVRFDSFYWSFLNTFMILSGENWDAMYYLTSTVAWVSSPLFFLTWILLGQYILLNLVMAVILEECGNVMGGGGNRSLLLQRLNQVRHAYQLRMAFCHWNGLYRSESMTPRELELLARASETEPRFRNLKSADVFLLTGLYYSRSSSRIGLLLRRATERRLKATGERFEPVVRRFNAYTGMAIEQKGGEEGEEEALAEAQARAALAARKRRYKARRHSSFLPTATWRAEVKMLVTHPLFNDVVLFVIVLNSYVVCWADPRGPDPLWLQYTQIISVSIFLMEALLKIVAYHAFTGPKAFFRDRVNVFDFVLVVTMVGALVAEHLNYYTASSILGAILSVRPVRLLLRIPAIREMLVALAASVASLGTLGGVLLFCMYAYALVGCQLYQGAFYKCDDPSFPPGAALFGPDAVPCNGRISNSFYNFDNVANGMVSVFIMCTIDGWSAIMFDCLNAVGPGLQPQYNTNSQAFPYLFVGVSFFGFFMMQMFVGVVFDNFQRIRALRMDGSVISEELKAWDEQYHRIRRLTPLARKDPPKNWIGKLAFRLVRSDAFERLLLSVIALNAVFLCLQGLHVSPGLHRVSMVFDSFVASFFVLEAVCKCLALGPHRYWRSSSNRFDLLITGVGLVDLVVSDVYNCGDSKILIFTILRSLRVLRLLRILNAFTSLRVIMRAIIFPIGKLLMVGLIMGVVIFVYANLSVTAFNHVILPSPVQTFANFQSIQDCMCLFFMLCTGELYNDTLTWLADYPTTSLRPVAQALYKPFVIAFLVSFQIAVKILLFNLFVLVIVEAYTLMLGDSGGIPEPLTLRFREEWRHFDPEATGKIPKLHLYTLMSCLPYPLGFAHGLRFRDKLLRITEMDLKGEFVRFHEVLQRMQDFIFEALYNRHALEHRLRILQSVLILQRFGRHVLLVCRAYRVPPLALLPPPHENHEDRRSKRVIEPQSPTDYGGEEVVWTGNPMAEEGVSERRRAQTGRREMMAATRWAMQRQEAREEERRRLQRKGKGWGTGETGGGGGGV